MKKNTYLVLVSVLNERSFEPFHVLIFCQNISYFFNFYCGVSVVNTPTSTHMHTVYSQEKTVLEGEGQKVGSNSQRLSV